MRLGVMEIAFSFFKYVGVGCSSIGAMFSPASFCSSERTKDVICEALRRLFVGCMSVSREVGLIIYIFTILFVRWDQHRANVQMHCICTFARC